MVNKSYSKQVLKGECAFPANMHGTKTATGKKRSMIFNGDWRQQTRTCDGVQNHTHRQQLTFTADSDSQWAKLIVKKILCSWLSRVLFYIIVTVKMELKVTEH